jgi:arabinosaccharide transport system substrate-binding protein
MEFRETHRKPSRRDILRGLGFTVGALVAGPTLAACAPVAAPAPGGSGASAAEPIALELWTFVNTHARWFRSMAEDYKEEVNPNFDLTVNEIAYGEMHDKLLIALQSGGVGAPDISDIEQGRFGGFLRGGEPGLVDIKDRLEGGGHLENLVAAREALYTYQGKIYGIEHALTPVVLYFRHDVWGVDDYDHQVWATWDDYIAAAQEVAGDGVAALPFPNLEVLLRQQGSDYFNADGEIIIDSEISIETMQWILNLRDQYGIAAQAPTGEAWWAAVKEGRFVSQIGADWYAGFFKDNAPEMEGQWQGTLLPAWEPGGRTTSCLGGTGACVVQTSRHVEEAWNFLEFSMLSEEGNVRRFEMTNLFPPYIPAMGNERLQAADAYFNGQNLGALFAEAGPNVPEQYQSPYRAELNALLTTAWQDLYDGNTQPEQVFSEIASKIRDSMASDQ